MSSDPVVRRNPPFEPPRELSGGAIAGLVIGILLLVVCIIGIIIWYLRFRHYWASRKHTKMSNHVGAECGMANGAHNNPYMSDPSDGPTSTESWTTGPGKFSSCVSSWWPTDSSQMQRYTATSLPYPLPNAPWAEISEVPIDPTRARPVYSTIALGAANPAPYPITRDTFYGFDTGDLSQSAMGVPSVYPNLSTLTSCEEPTTTTTSSNGKKASMHSISQKMRSKVRMAARVSNIPVFSLRPKRRTSSRIHDSIRGRTKRRRGTRNSNVTIGSTTVMGGHKFSMTPDEGYHNMNVISDSFEFDEVGSLDNDDFLCSLEKAVFPGLDGSQISSSGTQSYRPSVAMESQSRSSGITPNVIHPLSDFYTLSDADLGLGSGSAPTTWRPLAPEPDQSSSSRSSQPIGFRFPAPGPPVSGWAHQLARFSMQETNTAGQTIPETTLSEILTRQSAPLVSTTVSSPVKAIQPPPDVSTTSTSTIRSSIPGQGPSWSVAIPRRRAEKRAKARQQSEPRASASRHESDNSNSFTPPDPSTEERRLSASRHPLLPLESVSRHTKPQHKSPSFPNFFVIHTTSHLDNSCGPRVTPGVLLPLKPHLMWTDSNVADHVITGLQAVKH